MTNTTQGTKTFRDLAADRKERIIRKQELLKMIGLSDATIWRKERAGTFPKRLKLGGNSCGWFESEIIGWMEQLSAGREA